MNALHLFRGVAWVCCFTVFLGLFPQVVAQDSKGFRSLLELAELGPKVLSELSTGDTYSDADWQTLQQVFSRLNQFRDFQPEQPPLDSFPESWQDSENTSIGNLFELHGRIVAVTAVPLPADIAERQKKKAIYRCAFQFTSSKTDKPHSVILLTTQIPEAWLVKQTLDEPVRLRGVLVQLTQIDAARRALLLTTHIGWYPTAGVSTGKLLLARQGMDVALLDEVRHRHPFVKLNVSRESEAFYAGLIAMKRADPVEIKKLATENIGRVAERYRAKQSELHRTYKQLQAKVDRAAEGEPRQQANAKAKRAKVDRDLALTVLRQAKLGQSSVAPMFLHPKQEVGELYAFRGIARRAVRIAVENQGDFDAYYELEVHTAEAGMLEDQPVVCCVTQLPEGFPTGDEIRESVHVAGLFFKSWRYNSREIISAEEDGEAAKQRQLYTPLLLGHSPTWLVELPDEESPWPMVGGIAFLAILIFLWIGMTWLARRDRRARAAMRPHETIEIEAPREPPL